MAKAGVAGAASPTSVGWECGRFRPAARVARPGMPQPGALGLLRGRKRGFGHGAGGVQDVGGSGARARCFFF